MLEPLSTDFINKIKILRKKYNFKLIFDEVFTGFYKSEKMFYFQNFENIFPDIICPKSVIPSKELPSFNTW